MTMSLPTGAAAGLGQGVLLFLSSLGQRSEAELYLRIYRGLGRDEFALLILAKDVLEHAVGTLAEQLSLLSELGLSPHLLVGADGPVEEELLEQLDLQLREVDLEARFVELDCEEVPSLKERGKNELVVFHLKHSTDEILSALCGRFTPRKTLFLRARGGLGPHRDDPLELTAGHFLQSSRSGIGVINLRSDAGALRSLSLLDAEDTRLLTQAETILHGPTGTRSRATVSVTSPGSILRELFTVSGDGTLIKLGAVVSVHPDKKGVDQERVNRLLEESFGRHVRTEFWDRPLRRIHLESDYRGVAILEEGRVCAYLSKFAVLPVARGEGLGQDLWWSLAKNDHSFYWRSRPENPINSWYATVADGVHKTPKWHVYWRGIEAEKLPEIIGDALDREEDFF